MVAEADTGAAFDIAAAAGWYSAVAGLLAGFALLAVLLPLDHETSDETAESAGASGVLVFTSAFFSLLILAFTYAILSGRPLGPVAAHEQQINGSAFGLASLLLILGLREVLRLYGSNRAMMQPAQNLVALTTAIWGPMIVVGLNLTNTIDLELLREGGAMRLTWPFSWGIRINVLISVAALVLIALTPVTTRGWKAAPASTASVGMATLGFTVVVVLWSAMVVPFLPGSFLLSAGLEHAVITLSALGAVAYSWAAWLTR